MYFGYLCHGYALNFHFVYLADFRDTSVTNDNAKSVLFICNSKSKIHICSSEHETDFVRESRRIAL